MYQNLWVLSVFHYLYNCVFSHPPFLFLFNCVGVLQHGNSRWWMDGNPAQRGRQRGLPEDVEGVQDGETRQIRRHRHSRHSSISIKHKLRNSVISKTSCFKNTLLQNGLWQIACAFWPLNMLKTEERQDAVIQDHLERLSQMSFLLGNSSPVVSVLAVLSRVSEICSAPQPQLRWHAVILPLFQQEIITQIWKQHICLVSIARCLVYHLFVIKEKPMHICINGVNISNLSCV